MNQPQSQQSSLLATLVRGASIALSIQVASSGIVYASQVLLARWMGSEEYGIYDYVSAVSLSLALLAGFGLPGTVLRFIPTYRAQQHWSYLQGIIRGSWWQTLIASLVISGCSTGIWLQSHGTRNLGEYALPLLVGLWTTPVIALVNLQREVIRGLQQIALAYIPSLILHPALLAGMAGVWQQQRDLTSTSAVGLFLLSGGLILALQWLWFQRNLAAAISKARPAYETVRWWRTALPLTLLSGSQIVLSQTDTLAIGIILDAKQVGIYGAALKTSAWVPFILIAVNAIAAPLIASLYAQGDRRGLQQTISTVARWMFYPALVTAIGLISFAEPVLRLFGSEFAAAKGALIVLTLGQLVNVGSGSVGYLAIMTGHQNRAAKVMLVTAVVNVVLNWIGIPLFGIVGAALATAFSMSLWNIWLYTFVVRQLGVFPSILDAYRS